MSKQTEEQVKSGQQLLDEAGLDTGKMQQIDTDLDNYPDHDFDQDPVAFGVIVKIKDATVKRIKGDQVEHVDTRLMIVENPNGKFTLWESANLKNLFDTAGVGQTVVVRFTHKEPLPGGKSMRMFEAHLSK